MTFAAYVRGWWDYVWVTLRARLRQQGAQAGWPETQHGAVVV